MVLTGDKKRAYQLAFIKKRRDAWIAENGPCQKCGSLLDLEVDHIIPRSVAGGISPGQLWTRRLEVRVLELAKCQVLCSVCHKTKSDDEQRTKEHGVTMYRNGCRCDTCRNAQRDRARKRRDSRTTRRNTR